ncbi:30S ribosomal protein S15 [Buchnera aphidicola]|uniref:30S ribosomal protein S15 n=1 Tax=Buchnera aphidicola TaxID=9 RepID=UPI0031B8B20A
MKKNNQITILKYSTNKTNTGKTEVQIALLTDQINYLKKHFNLHKKDFSGKKGLLNMVSKRKKLLHYLKDSDLNRYIKIISQLSLRR